MLADLAVSEPFSFRALVHVAQQFGAANQRFYFDNGFVQHCVVWNRPNDWKKSSEQLQESVVVEIFAEAVEPRYTSTPVGHMLSHCVHSVPSGSHLVQSKEGGLDVFDRLGTFLKHLPSCDTDNGRLKLVKEWGQEQLYPYDYDGWLGYTAFEDDQGFDSFLGDFSVPDKPSEDPDVLYLFTGLQNIDWIPIVDPEPHKFDIIQPVLQFPGDLGSYWSVKSWYVTLDAGAVASDEIRVDAGDFLFGNMTKTGATSWYIGSTVGSSSKTTSISVTHDRLAVQPWAYNTLECYGCSGCSTYPQRPCKFSNLTLTSEGKHVSPSWIDNPKPSKNMQCGEKPVVYGPSNVDIFFQKHN